MTDAERQDLNERVARRLGYIETDMKRRIDHVETGFWWRLPPGQDIYLIPLPDFTREWEYAGPLFVEMVVELGWHEACSKVWDEVLNDPNVAPEDAELTEAIALAFDAWAE